MVLSGEGWQFAEALDSPATQQVFLDAKQDALFSEEPSILHVAQFAQRIARDSDIFVPSVPDPLVSCRLYRKTDEETGQRTIGIRYIDARYNAKEPIVSDVDVCDVVEGTLEPKEGFNLFHADALSRGVACIEADSELFYCDMADDLLSITTQEPKIFIYGTS